MPYVDKWHWELLSFHFKHISCLQKCTLSLLYNLQQLGNQGRQQKVVEGMAAITGMTVEPYQHQ